MVVELVYEEGFEGTPEDAGVKKRPIFRNEFYVGRIPSAGDLVRTTAREDTALDPQTLLDNLKLQKVRRFNGSDALDQMPSPVLTADHGPNAALVTRGADRMS